MAELPKVIRIMEDDYETRQEYLDECKKAICIYPYTAKLYDGTVFFRTVEDCNNWVKMVEGMLEEGE